MKGKILKQHVKDFRTIVARLLLVALPGAIQMLRDVDVESASVILLNMAQARVYTKEIVRRMQPGAKLVVIEYNEPLTMMNFAEKYSDNSNVHVVHGSAENVRAMVRALGIRGQQT